jgi:hypothetical protein
VVEREQTLLDALPTRPWRWRVSRVRCFSSEEGIG